MISTHDIMPPPSPPPSAALQELSRHVPVHAYGRCLPELRAPTARVQANYKFSIALEAADSHSHGKVSEKLWNALWSNTVPILKTRRHYDPVLPSARAAVFLQDFGGDVAALARHLQRLDADDSAYREYFAWKTEGAAPGFAHTLLTSAVLWPCHLCDEMQYLYELKWRWREGRRARACGARNCSAGVRRAGGHVVRPS